MSAHARVLDLIETVSREPAWLADHRAEVLAAVRACDQDGLRETGTRLAAAAWPAARTVADPDWLTELAEAGEALAIADRDPAALVDLLHSSAITFAEQGDRLRAEERWVRALAIIRRDGCDPDRVLSALGALYRDWGRLSKALDVYLRLVDLRRSDPAGLAAALTEVAITMYAAGRLQSATDYFDRADETLSEIAAAPVRETMARPVRERPAPVSGTVAGSVGERPAPVSETAAGPMGETAAGSVGERAAPLSGTAAGSVGERAAPPSGMAAGSVGERAAPVSQAAAASQAHVQVLLWCGRTRWELGEHGPARRRWSRALALLVDVDDEAANKVRTLLAAEPEDILDFPYLPGASSSNTASSPSGGVG